MKFTISVSVVVETESLTAAHKLSDEIITAARGIGEITEIRVRPVDRKNESGRDYHW